MNTKFTSNVSVEKQDRASGLQLEIYYAGTMVCVPGLETCTIKIKIF